MNSQLNLPHGTKQKVMTTTTTTTTTTTVLRPKKRVMKKLKTKTPEMLRRTGPVIVARNQKS